MVSSTHTGTSVSSSFACNRRVVGRRRYSSPRWLRSHFLRCTISPNPFYQTLGLFPRHYAAFLPSRESWICPSSSMCSITAGHRRRCLLCIVYAGVPANQLCHVDWDLLIHTNCLSANAPATRTNNWLQSGTYPASDVQLMLTCWQFHLCILRLYLDFLSSCLSSRRKNRRIQCSASSYPPACASADLSRVWALCRLQQLVRAQLG